MNGKSKCKILKQIRQQIARENGIAYVVSECKHKGDCAGTCPKCEAEVRYLEEELRKRQLSGKKVAIAGVAAALIVTASGCDLTDILHPATGGDPLPPDGYYEDLQGVPAYPPPTSLPVDVPGEIPVETLTGDPTEATMPTGELMGDFPAPPEE